MSDDAAPKHISEKDRREGLYEATLNEADRRINEQRLREEIIRKDAELARRDKLTKVINLWGLAAIGIAGGIFTYFDTKFTEHVRSTNATEKAAEKNASDIAALDARTKADAASFDARTKANTLWIQDVQGEQKAFEQSERTEGLKTTIEINNLKNDVTNLKGHR